jgi:hypothetical protein
MRAVEKRESRLKIGRRDFSEHFDQLEWLLIVDQGFDDLLAMLEVLVACFDVFLLELFASVLLDHDLFCVSFSLVARDCLLVPLLPDPKPSVESACNDEISRRGDDYIPNL